MAKKPGLFCKANYSSSFRVFWLEQKPFGGLGGEALFRKKKKEEFSVPDVIGRRKNHDHAEKQMWVYCTFYRLCLPMLLPLLLPLCSAAQQQQTTTARAGGGRP